MDALQEKAYSLIDKLEALTNPPESEEPLVAVLKYCLVYTLRRFCHLNVSHLRIEEELTLPLLLELGDSFDF